MDCYQDNFLLTAKYQLRISVPRALGVLVILSTPNLQMAQALVFSLQQAPVQRVKVSVEECLLEDFKGNSYIRLCRLLWKSVFYELGNLYGSYLRFILWLDLF